uniref:Uncharacterized protein n=1 Tax=Amphimedon queenslandica TaxID=400682 RepID=A0A1X7TXS8_AMPQE
MKTQQKAEMSRQRGYERTQLKRRKRLILREMAEQECKRMIAYETAVDINDEEEIMNIVLTAYHNIMEYNGDREEVELRTINGSIEDDDKTIEETNFGPESEHNPLLTIQNTQEISL